MEGERSEGIKVEGGGGGACDQIYMNNMGCRGGGLKIEI